jgi:hypothetical protein
VNGAPFSNCSHLNKGETDSSELCELISSINIVALFAYAPQITSIDWYSFRCTQPFVYQDQSTKNILIQCNVHDVNVFIPASVTTFQGCFDDSLLKQ